MFDKLKQIVARQPKDVFMLVREGNFGIESYVNPAIAQFNKAYKKQLMAFLEGLITMLKDGENTQKPR